VRLIKIFVFVEADFSDSFLRPDGRKVLNIEIVKIGDRIWEPFDYCLVISYSYDLRGFFKESKLAFSEFSLLI
jgi:hypothetical protein